MGVDVAKKDDPIENPQNYCVKINVTAEPLYPPKLKKNKLIEQNRKIKLMPHQRIKPKLDELIIKSGIPPSIQSLHGPAHLVASVLPSAFPPSLSFRALAAYSTIRTLSVQLRLSPFSPIAFLRALSLPLQSRLIGDIHSSILRILYASNDLGIYHYRGDGLSKMKLPPKNQNDGISEYVSRKDFLYPNAGENLLYLDHITWPLYLCDYVNLTDEVEEVKVESALLDGYGMNKSFFQSKPSELLSTEIESKMRSTQNSKTPIVARSIQQQHQMQPIMNYYGAYMQQQQQSRQYQHLGPVAAGTPTPQCQPMGTENASLQQRMDNPVQQQQYQPYSDIMSGNAFLQQRMYNPMQQQQYQTYSDIMSGQNATNKVGKITNYLSMNQNNQTLEETSKKRKLGNISYVDTGSCSDADDCAYEESDDEDFKAPSHLTSKIRKRNDGRQEIVSQRSQHSSFPVQSMPLRQYVSKKYHKNPRALPTAKNFNLSTTSNPRLVKEEVNDEIHRFLIGEKNDYLKIETSDKTDLSTDKTETDGDEKLENEEKEDSNESLGETEHEDSVVYKPPLKAVKRLKSGKAYCFLSIEEKLSALEYILDELMHTEDIRNMFGVRHSANFFKPKLYGKLPNEKELADLENEDECRICDGEGDLICCDGCVASYHRECVNIPLSRVMRDEKWFCHECNIPDSSRLGPLRGGQKSCLDWFNLHDTSSTSNEIDFQNHVSSDLSHFYAQPLPVINDTTVRCQDMFKHVEFLIVHGYVFARDKFTKDRIDIYSILAPEQKQNEVGKTTEMTPLSQIELFSLLCTLGPSICLQWPWAQIPFNPNELTTAWKYITDPIETQSDTLLSSFESIECKRRYMEVFFKTEYFNPLSYWNSYEKAPLNRAVTSKIGRRKIKLSQTVLQAGMNNVLLRPVLTRDTKCDNQIASLLRSGLFDPLEPIRNYMTSLESQLLRSTLLHELWGCRSKSLDMEWWRDRVSRCNSITVMCKLLVKLIDDTVSRAFVDEWNMLPGVSNDDVVTFNNENRSYTGLPEDWTQEKEIVKRKWDRCLENDILSLVSKDCNTTRASNGKRYRKGKRSNLLIWEKDYSVREMKEKSSMQTEADHIEIEEIMDESENEKSHKRNKETKKGRRRSDRRQNTLNTATCSMQELINRTLTQYEAQCTDDEVFQSDWPLAGRKLFIPEGCLSQSTLKWLGRNAGVRLAPHVHYPKKFEIGLPSVCQIWRKKTLDASSLEKLVYQIRLLDSYLNKHIISSLDSMTRRYGQLKGTIQKVVKCSHIDRATGSLDYFVVNRGKHRGCWLSSKTVDASTFVVHRNTRVLENRDKRQKLIAVRDEMRKKQEAAEMEALAQKAAAAAREIAAQNAAAAKEAAAKKAAARKAAAAKKAAAVRATRKKVEGKHLSRESVDAKMNPILLRHELKVKSLMRLCREKRLSVVPTHLLQPLRETHFAELRQACKVNQISFYDAKQISGKLTQAELDGTRTYVEEIRKAINMQGTSQVANSKVSPINVSDKRKPSMKQQSKAANPTKSGNFKAPLSQPHKINNQIGQQFPNSNHVMSQQSQHLGVSSLAQNQMVQNLAFNQPHQIQPQQIQPQQLQPQQFQSQQYQSQQYQSQQHQSQKHQSQKRQPQQRQPQQYQPQQYQPQQLQPQQLQPQQLQSQQHFIQETQTPNLGQPQFAQQHLHQSGRHDTLESIQRNPYTHGNAQQQQKQQFQGLGPNVENQLTGLNLQQQLEFQRQHQLRVQGFGNKSVAPHASTNQSVGEQYGKAPHHSSQHEMVSQHFNNNQSINSTHNGPQMAVNAREMYTQGHGEQSIGSLGNISQFPAASLGNNSQGNNNNIVNSHQGSRSDNIMNSYQGNNNLMNNHQGNNNIMNNQHGNNNVMYNHQGISANDGNFILESLSGGSSQNNVNQTDYHNQLNPIQHSQINPTQHSQMNPTQHTQMDPTQHGYYYQGHIMK